MQPPSRHPSSLSWEWLSVWEGSSCRRFSFFGGLGLLSCPLFSPPLFLLSPCRFAALFFGSLPLLCLSGCPLLLLFFCLLPRPLPCLLLPSLSGLHAFCPSHVTAAATWLTALLTPSQFLWVGARPLPGGPRQSQRVAVLLAVLSASLAFG